MHSAAAVIAIDGEYGTLSEIALALRSRIPVVGLGTWTLVRPDGDRDERILRAGDPAAAVAMAITLASVNTRQRGDVQVRGEISEVQ